jgi:hypothetical protein
VRVTKKIEGEGKGEGESEASDKTVTAQEVVPAELG